MSRVAKAGIGAAVIVAAAGGVYFLSQSSPSTSSTSMTSLSSTSVLSSPASASAEVVTHLLPPWAAPPADVQATFQQSTGLTVQENVTAYDALHDKLVTALSAGTVPADVCEMDESWVSQFGPAGWCLPLDDLIDSTHPEWRQQMPQMPTFQWKGATIGIPWANYFKIGFYNSKYLSQAGIDSPPETWTDLFSQCVTIKSKGLLNYPMAFALAASNDCYITITLLTWSLGGDYFDKNWNPIMNQSNSATIQGLNMIVDGLYNTKVVDPASLTFGTGHEHLNNFIAGNAAFMINNNTGGMPVANDPTKSKIVGEAKYFLEPGGNGVRSTSWAGNESWIIPKGDQNVQNAWKYIEWYLSTPTQVALWKEAGIPSAKTVDYEVESQQGLLQQPDVLAAQAGYIHNELELQQIWYTDFQSAVYTETSNVASRAKTPQKAMDDLANTILNVIYPKYKFKPTG